MPEANDEYVLELARQLAPFVEADRDDLPEVLYHAALSMIEAAVARTRNWHWWRSHPNGEVNRLTDRLATALELARLAASLQETDNRHELDLERELRDAATEAATRRRRAQTLPAERARLAKQDAQREAKGSTSG